MKRTICTDCRKFVYEDKYISSPLVRQSVHRFHHYANNEMSLNSNSNFRETLNKSVNSRRTLEIQGKKTNCNYNRQTTSTSLRSCQSEKRFHSDYDANHQLIEERTRKRTVHFKEPINNIENEEIKENQFQTQMRNDEISFQNNNNIGYFSKDNDILFLSTNEDEIEGGKTDENVLKKMRRNQKDNVHNTNRLFDLVIRSIHIQHKCIKLYGVLQQKLEGNIKRRTMWNILYFILSLLFLFLLLFALINVMKNQVVNQEKLLIPKFERMCKTLIEEELQQWEWKRVELADFALDKLGGEVDPFCSESYGGQTYYIFGMPLLLMKIKPSIINSWRGNYFPGDCWPFKGEKASIRIKLQRFIIVTAVTIDHIPAKSLPTEDMIRSSPKNFAIYVELETGKPNIFLGHFQFDVSSATNSIQTFDISNATIPSRSVIFQFISNNGHPNFTCIYRLRVHGRSSY
ncbi:hypothetical protein SNEBB_002252 [Seison nebaliae]|nr:hypothetical protein SNEBB_002252 [Seison nebaliae]